MPLYIHNENNFTHEKTMSQGKRQFVKPSDNKSWSIALGERVRLLRTSKKIHQRDLAADYVLGSQNAVTRIEQGKFKSLTADQIQDLAYFAIACGKSIEWLFTGKDPSPEQPSKTAQPSATVNVPDTAGATTINIYIQTPEQSR